MRLSHMILGIVALLLTSQCVYAQSNDHLTPADLDAISQQIIAFRNLPRVKAQSKKVALYRELIETAKTMDASEFSTIRNDRKEEHFRISTRGGIEIENEQGRENAIQNLEAMIQQLTFPEIPLYGFFNQEEDAMETRQSVLVGVIQQNVDILSTKGNELLVGTTRTSLDPQRGFSPGTRAEATRRNLVDSGKLPKARDPRRNTWDLCLYRIRNVDTANYKSGELGSVPTGIYRVLDWGDKSDRAEHGLFRGAMYVLELERLTEEDVQQIEQVIQSHGNE